MSPERVCTLVAACCVLHNIAVDFNEPVQYDDDDQGLNLGHNYDGPNRGKLLVITLQTHTFHNNERH